MNWKRVGWTDEIAKCLTGALNKKGLAAIAQEVSESISTLWHVEDCGYFVTRLESCTVDDSRELVLVAYEGRNVKPLVDHLQDVCVNEGIQSMRFHTEINQELVTRFVAKMNFEPVETVYRWSI